MGHRYAVVHRWSDSWVVLRSLGSAPEEIVLQVRRGEELICSLTLDALDDPDGPFVHAPSLSAVDSEPGIAKLRAFARATLPCGPMMSAVLLKLWISKRDLVVKVPGLPELRGYTWTMRKSDLEPGQDDDPGVTVDSSAELSLLSGNIPLFWRTGQAFDDWVSSLATVVEL